MDVTIILKPFITAMWWVLPIVILVGLVQTSWFKGWLGEWWVNRLLTKRLNPEEYHVLNDLTLKTHDGTTQIDHVVIAQTGVFIIETKNMTGWIFGTERQRDWTQQIYRTKHRFQNPLRQNHKHLKTAEALLNLPASSYYSAVIFLGGCTLKSELPPNVGHASEVIDWILSKNEKILSQSEVQMSVEQLESHRLERTWKTQRDHIKHVNYIKAQKRANKP